MLGKLFTYGINGSFGSSEKMSSITYSKTSRKFCLSLHYNSNNSYLFVSGKEIIKFKADNKNVNFLAQFCLRSIFNRSDATESREVSVKENVYDFSIIMLLINLTYKHS